MRRSPGVRIHGRLSAITGRLFPGTCCSEHVGLNHVVLEHLHSAGHATNFVPPG